jgi:peptide/nickel transport system ATP-binding protein
MAGIGTAHLRPAEQALIRAEHLVVEYPTRRGVVQAVSDVSFDVLPGETVGIVGESGCGKSTTARALLQLPPATGGSVRLDGHELTGLSRSELREARRQMQIILQDPISSINPRRTIGDVVAEPLDIWGVAPGERAARVDQALDSVGLVPDHVRSRRRHELSGGQCQRVCIARALIGGPRLLVCDEAVSALDSRCRRRCST